MYKIMERKIEETLSEDQFRFRKNMGTKGSDIGFKINNGENNMER